MTLIRLYTPVALSKTYMTPDQNGQSVYPFSDPNSAKTLPGGAAHTYMALKGALPRGLFMRLFWFRL